MKRKDPLTPQERSELMGKVRSAGAVSTERAVERILRSERLWGWTKNPWNVDGKPDFYFRRAKLALFVDGCFWHGCPKCRRRLPQSRKSFWAAKIKKNIERDRKVKRLLAAQGVCVQRIWEHEVAGGRWIQDLRIALAVRLIW